MKQATWIWYPGDFEVWLGNIFNNRRTERGAMFPPFWKQDSHYVTVEFSKAFTLAEEETIAIACEGLFNFAIDGKLQFPSKIYNIPAGKHKLNIKVWNQATPPTIFIQGETIITDSTWLATYEDKLWIDENGVAHGSGIYVPAASWNFNDADTPPSEFRLCHRDVSPISCETISTNKKLYDFGRETFGQLCVQTNAEAGRKGMVTVCYGESREEALDKEYCETLDRFTPELLYPHPVRRMESKAFRYVYIETGDEIQIDKVWMEYVYAPFDESNSGSFRCSDDELNHIWEVAARTLELTTQEFFMDGIKRDRWTWSGDAIQSYLMNYYLHADNECVKRTIRQLRGKDPVTAHVNTIMDYTFYWFKSVLDYYEYSGDKDFVAEIYPRMQTLMDYVLGRTNAEGMAEGQPDDWIFVDWTDFPMHKRGTLCFEQILFCKALQTMSTCAQLLGKDNPYAEKAGELLQKLKETFWNKEQKAFMHAIEDGKMNCQITKFPNMFAIIYDMVDDETKQAIMQSTMLNPEIPAITTPYMRFYELEALCQTGKQAHVLSEMKDYWGGMIKEGATSFWEKYNPSEHGTQHLAMYGRPYGKSLCHAWGASPIYLIGKYFLGVKPTSPGYGTFEVRPQLAGLKWLEGSVPTPLGPISVSINDKQIKITSPGGKGTLVWNGSSFNINQGYNEYTI